MKNDLTETILPSIIAVQTLLILGRDIYFTLTMTTALETIYLNVYILV